MMYDSLVKGTRCRPGGIGIKSNFPSQQQMQFLPVLLKLT